MWNPVSEIDGGNVDETVDEDEDHFMFFSEIAAAVGPIIDRLFPVGSGVRVIGEPGRYFVAASSSLCASVVSTRCNLVDDSLEPEAIDDKEAAKNISKLTRDAEVALVQRHRRGMSSMSAVEADTNVMEAIQEEFADYAKLFASQQLAQQEVDVYNDPLDLFREGFESAADVLGPPTEDQMERQHHTVEGMSYPLVSNAAMSFDQDILAEDAQGGGAEDQQAPSGDLLTMAAAGEAVVNGVVLQAIADSAPLQDDYAYYINDGVYGAFNNIMFDHAAIRPRVLDSSVPVSLTNFNGSGLKLIEKDHNGKPEIEKKERKQLFASTVFGPTCDSIDCVARAVLLPKLEIGDWLYFQNMGAYTSAAASAFNGFQPSEKLYVCSVPPNFFTAILSGPDGDAEDSNEEKKE